MKNIKIYNKAKYSLNINKCINSLKEFKNYYYQVIFYCKTCSKLNNKTNIKNVICYNCKINCHRNHELIEIGIRNNYICECFNKFNCNYKDSKNLSFEINNIYDKNFDKIYCCSKIIKSSLFQCDICYNFKHFNCEINTNLGNIIKNYPKEKLHSLSYICKNCIKINLFFFELLYKQLIIDEKNIDNYLCNKINIKSIKNCNGLYIQDQKYNNKNNGLIIHKEWFKYICNCINCIDAYKKLNLYNNIKYRIDSCNLIEKYINKNLANILTNKQLFLSRLKVHLEDKYNGNLDYFIKLEDINSFFVSIKLNKIN